MDLQHIPLLMIQFQPNRVGPTEHQFNIYSSYMQQQQVPGINGHSAVNGPMVSPSYMNGTHRLPLFSDFAQKSQQEVRFFPQQFVLSCYC